jgi:hypothetical protein
MTNLQQALMAAGPFDINLNQVIELNSSAGGYWFSPDTMAWFWARVVAGPVKFGRMLYLVETSRAGLSDDSGRRYRLLAIHILIPRPVQIINEGPGRGPVMKAYEAITSQARELARLSTVPARGGR